MLKVLLTRTEKRILELLARGYEPKAIAPMVGISYHTYNGYGHIIRVKLRATTTSQAVAIAVANTLIYTGDILGFEEG